MSQYEGKLAPQNCLNRCIIFHLRSQHYCSTWTNTLACIMACPCTLSLKENICFLNNCACTYLRSSPENAHFTDQNGGITACIPCGKGIEIKCWNWNYSGIIALCKLNDSMLRPQFHCDGHTHWFERKGEISQALLASKAGLPRGGGGRTVKINLCNRLGPQGSPYICKIKGEVHLSIMFSE